MMGTFVEWVCPECHAMWVYRRSPDGLAAMHMVQAEHRCAQAVSGAAR